MRLEQFFDKYPEAIIVMFRRRKLWYASLFKDENDENVIVIARAKNQQMALGNLAAQLLHKEPEGGL